MRTVIISNNKGFMSIIDYLGRGTPVTKSHLVPHSTPTFLELCYVYSCSDWSRARSFAKVIDKTTVRLSFVTLLQTNKNVRRLPCLWTTIVLRDVLIVALGVHVVVVLTRTPLVNEESTPRRLLMRRW